MTLALLPHEENELKIRQLVLNIKGNFLELGELLLQNRENAHYSHHHGSFDDFIESLGIGSKSWAYRVMDMAQLQRCHPLFPKERIIDIGFSKMTLLLPAAKKQTLDEDTVLLAQDCTMVALKEHLGHKIPEMSDDFINCPNCGFEIKGVKRTRRDDEGKCKF